MRSLNNIDQHALKLAMCWAGSHRIDQGHAHGFAGALEILTGPDFSMSSLLLLQHQLGWLPWRGSSRIFVVAD